MFLKQREHRLNLILFNIGKIMIKYCMHLMYIELFIAGTEASKMGHYSRIMKDM